MPINEQILQWLTLASHVVSVASAVAAVTPAPKTQGNLDKAYRILQILAFNIGQAANAKDASKPAGVG
jgi:hypothetical protein